MSILSVKDLTVNYGAIRALKGICLDVEPGEIITLIGANGAGKTSTMNAIMGVIPKTGGSVIFNGENIARSDTVSIVKKGVILAPEGRQIFPDFTVRDNLLMGGYHSTPEENHARMKDVLEIFPVLGDRMKQLAGLYGKTEAANARRAEPRSRSAADSGDLPHDSAHPRHGCNDPAR